MNIDEKIDKILDELDEKKSGMFYHEKLDNYSYENEIMYKKKAREAIKALFEKDYLNKEKFVGEKIFTHREPTEFTGSPETLDEKGEFIEDIADWVERFYVFDTGDKFKLTLTKL